jgi:transcriptional regulator with XRE-family HTH domain
MIPQNIANQYIKNVKYYWKVIDILKITNMESKERLQEFIATLYATKVTDSQEKLAKLLEYSPSTLSRFLSGKAPLNEHFLKRLARFYPALNEEWLLSGKGQMLKEGESIKVKPIPSKFQQERKEEPRAEAEQICKQEQMMSLLTSLEKITALLEGESRRVSVLEERCAKLEQAVYGSQNDKP